MGFLVLRTGFLESRQNVVLKTADAYHALPIQSKVGCSAAAPTHKFVLQLQPMEANAKLCPFVGVPTTGALQQQSHTKNFEVMVAAFFSFFPVLVALYQTVYGFSRLANKLGLRFLFILIPSVLLNACLHTLTRRWLAFFFGWQIYRLSPACVRNENEQENAFLLHSCTV